MTTFIRAGFRLDTLLSNDGDIIYFHLKTSETFQLFDYELDLLKKSWEYPKSDAEAVLQVIGVCVRDAAHPKSGFQYHLQTFLQTPGSGSNPDKKKVSYN